MFVLHSYDGVCSLGKIFMPRSTVWSLLQPILFRMVPLGALLSLLSHLWLVWSILAAFKCFVCTCNCNSTFFSCEGENASPCGSEVEERVGVTVASVSGTWAVSFSSFEGSLNNLDWKELLEIACFRIFQYRFLCPSLPSTFLPEKKLYSISQSMMLESLIFFFFPVTPAEGLSGFLCISVDRRKAS